MNCQYRGCEKKISPERDGYFTCSLCNSQAYCSEPCRRASWGTSHLCPNTIEMDVASGGFARPYFYEDCLTQEEINNLPINSPAFDAYSIMSYDGNRLVRQWFQPPIVEPVGLPAFAEDFSKGKAVKYSRGVKMENKSFSTYAIDLYLNESETPITLTGTLAEMIYDSNPNKWVSELSKMGRKKNESKYVFWPYSAIDNLNIDVDLEFTIRADLRVGSTKVEENSPNAYVTAGVKLDRMKESATGTWSRNFLSNFKTQLKSKFKNRKSAVTSIDNLVLRHYMDPIGNAILLTFDMSTGSKPRLVDIEFEVPTAALRGVNEAAPTIVDEEYEPLELVHYFKCDPKDVDSVVALCMAIDKGLVTMPNPKELEKCASVVKQHAHQLQESVGEMDFVSNEVCSSIQAATDILFIDARVTASMTKLAERPDDALVEIEKWEAKYKQREGKGFNNKIQQGKMKVQMGLLKNALKRNKELLRKNGASQDKLNEYQGLINKIQEIEKR